MLTNFIKIKRILLSIALIMPAFLFAAGTTTPTMHFNVVNFSSYPIVWGFSLTNAYGSFNGDKAGGVLPAGSSTGASASLDFIANFIEENHHHHQTCIGSNWRFVIASGTNEATIKFNSTVTCGKDPIVNVTGLSQTLPFPTEKEINPANPKDGILICGYSPKLKRSDMADAAGSNYQITIYNISDKSSCTG